jgi:hypothetical protein
LSYSAKIIASLAAVWAEKKINAKKSRDYGKETHKRPIG